jgi:predicted Zn-dependent protease
MGDYEGGLKMLESAIRINPDLFLPYYNMAIAYTRMGKPKDGIAILRAYLKRNPKDYQRVQQLLKEINIELD